MAAATAFGSTGAPAASARVVAMVRTSGGKASGGVLQLTPIPTIIAPS